MAACYQLDQLDQLDQRRIGISMSITFRFIELPCIAFTIPSAVLYYSATVPVELILS